MAILVVINCMACASPTKGDVKPMEKDCQSLDSVVNLYFPELKYYKTDEDPLGEFNNIVSCHYPITDDTLNDILVYRLFFVDREGLTEIIKDKRSNKYYIVQITDFTTTIRANKIELENDKNGALDSAFYYSHDLRTSYNGLYQLLKDRYLIQQPKEDEVSGIIAALFGDGRIDVLAEPKAIRIENTQTLKAYYENYKHDIGRLKRRYNINQWTFKHDIQFLCNKLKSSQEPKGKYATQSYVYIYALGRKLLFFEITLDEPRTDIHHRHYNNYEVDARVFSWMEGESMDTKFWNDGAK